MSSVLIVAASQEILLAILFFIIPAAALKYGGPAQQAAERDVAAQGVEIDGETLRRKGAQFSESRVEALLPLGIAVVLVAAAAIALRDGSLAYIVTWVIEVLLLFVVGLVTYGQVFPARSLRRAWEWGLTQSHIRNADYHAAADTWLPPRLISGVGLL